MLARFLCAGILAGMLSAQSSADRTQQWSEDIKYTATELVRTHPSLASRVDPAVLDQAFADLISAVPSKSDYEIVAGIARILALARDGHTFLDLFQPSTGFATYGLGVQWFSDGLFVTRASVPYVPMIGKRVTAIAGVPVEDAYLAIRKFISYENDPFARSRSERLLASPQALHVAGLISGPGAAEYEFEDAAGNRSKQVIRSNVGPIFPYHPAEPVNPISQRNPNLNYWFNYLPAARALYMQYNACEEAPALSMADFTTRVVDSLAAHPVDRFIIDLRNNGGGATNILHILFEGIAQGAMSGRFKFPEGVVITSRNTYSSAVNNAWELKQAESVLVGEDTGGYPASGETRVVTLPNSKLWFRVTVRADPVIDGTTLPVDVPVAFTSSDFFQGRDPYLDAALSVATKPPVLPQREAIPR